MISAVDVFFDDVVDVLWREQMGYRSQSSAESPLQKEVHAFILESCLYILGQYLTVALRELTVLLEQTAWALKCQVREVLDHIIEQVYW